MTHKVSLFQVLVILTFPYHIQILRRHGDVFERTSKGYYHAHGRADDTMNLGGIKVLNYTKPTMFFPSYLSKQILINSLNLLSSAGEFSGD